MNAIHLVAAAGLFAGFGWFLFAGDGGGAVAAAPSGHDVLVVTGDRDALAVTGGSHKESAWAGPARGLASAWSLSIRDTGDRELARVPLDMSAFALDPDSKGAGVTVDGCIVRDSRVAMLVNAPTFAAADRYVFLRGDTAIGSTPAAAVRRLVGGGR